AGQLGGGRERGIAEGTLVGAEALAATYLVTGIVKHIVRRQRPSVTHSEYGSFFSGHTSMAFASATMLTIYAYEYPWGSSRNRWTVPATAYTLAALTGYLRLGARRHWFSDVLVGALVGTGTSLVVHSVR
ncbi:MAG: membrane-associated phospholipid phosphatase, partial [Bradymonadia bacterium]